MIFPIYKRYKKPIKLMYIGNKDSCKNLTPRKIYMCSWEAFGYYFLWSDNVKENIFYPKGHFEEIT